VSNIATHSELCSGGAGFAAEKLQIGGPLYCDSELTFVSVPSFLVGATTIHTANGDANSDTADTEYLCFNIESEATVYILYDPRVADGEEPAWLTNNAVAQHKLVVHVSDTTTMKIFIYHYTSGPETVCVGGNRAQGATSHYVVAVTEELVFLDSDVKEVFGGNRAADQIGRSHSRPNFYAPFEF
jgi:hypothetical protein